jgi:hypothetical protein
VVEDEGLTETLPEAPNVPTPAIVTLVALGTLQVSVELPPKAIVPGEAEKDEPATVGQGVTLTVA